MALGQRWGKGSLKKDYWREIWLNVIRVLRVISSQGKEKGFRFLRFTKWKKGFGERNKKSRPHGVPDVMQVCHMAWLTWHKSCDMLYHVNHPLMAWTWVTQLKLNVNLKTNWIFLLHRLTTGGGEDLRIIKLILYFFEALSGPWVNSEKSCLFSSNRNSVRHPHFAKTLHYSIGSLPLTYLGIPIFGNRLRRQDWDCLITKIISRLAVWKSKFLSLEGRLTLLNFVLSAIPTY